MISRCVAWGSENTETDSKRFIISSIPSRPFLLHLLKIGGGGKGPHERRGRLYGCSAPWTYLGFDHIESKEEYGLFVTYKRGFRIAKTCFENTFIFYAWNFLLNFKYLFVLSYFKALGDLYRVLCQSVQYGSFLAERLSIILGELFYERNFFMECYIRTLVLDIV